MKETEFLVSSSNMSINSSSEESSNFDTDTLDSYESNCDLISFRKIYKVEYLLQKTNINICNNIQCIYTTRNPLTRMSAMSRMSS